MLTAVDELAAAMKAKLRQKAREGFSGGLHPNSRYTVGRALHKHVDRLTLICPHCQVIDGEREEEPQQAVDVCNLAMMLWVQGGKPT